MKVRASGVLIENGSICVVKHRRRGRSYFTLPGGGVEDHETIAAGLEREWLEETGITIERPELLFVFDVIAPGRQRHVLNFVFRVHRSALPGQDPRPRLGEHLDELESVGLDDFPTLKMVPPIQREIVDAIRDGTAAGRYLGQLWVDLDEEGK